MFDLALHIIILYHISFADATSTANWFGDFNQYQCHCNNSQCYNNGLCIDGSCEQGWFGFKCQYKSINFTTGNSLYPWLMDDDETTCNNISSIRSLYLILDEAYIFTWMRLIIKPTDELLQFALKLNSKSSYGHECIDQKTYLADHQTLDIWCSLNVIVQSITISGSLVPHLCSVYISGGRNVALKQETTQTSTYESLPSYISSKAVDGETNGDLSVGSCTHTDDETEPTWSVLFNTSYLINRFVINNRVGIDNEKKPNQEILGDRLRKFKLQVFNKDKTLLFSYSDTSNQSQEKYVIGTFIKEPAATVNITATNRNKNNKTYLTLCEVQIFGDCPSGKWGLNCNESCHTGCLHFCKIEDGTCQNVCMGKLYLTYNSSSCRADNQSPNTDLIVGSTVSVILILIGISAGIVVWRKPEFITRKLNRDSVNKLEKSERATSQEFAAADMENTPATCNDVNEYTSKHSEPGGDTDINVVVQPEDDTSISASEFNHFMTQHKLSYFLEQFEKIPSAVDVSMEAAQNEENKRKNRYKNICPYDHSRVILNINTDKNEGDYINASYIKGFTGNIEFIASQGPNEVTVNDFVRMLWENNVEQIVMLTDLIDDGKKKCEQYWPEEGKSYFGDIKVRLLSTVSMSDYTIRNLELAKKHEHSQQLTHYQFHAWPDKGVPDAPWRLLDFVHRVSNPHLTQLKLVHCSAGVGRTGTFIALLNILNQVKETGKMNFFQTVTNLRQDRIYMVQTARQYEFFHKAAQSAILCMNSTITKDDLINKSHSLVLNNIMDVKRIETEFKDLCTVCEVVNFEDPLLSNLDEENVYQNSEAVWKKEKNRFSSILSRQKYRPTLYIEGDQLGGYINAVYVQGMKQKDQYYLTQLPMPGTVDDFWKLVVQYKINVIVTFEQDEMTDDQTIAQFLPKMCSEVYTTPMFQLTNISWKQTLLWDEQRVAVSYRNKPESVSHEVFCIQSLFKDLITNKWLNLVKHLQSTNVPQGKVIYVCKNGAQYSGLLCALTVMSERIENEKQVNIPLLVGSLKSVRPEIVSSLEQYKMMYDVLKLYSETLTHYVSLGHRFLREML